MSDDNEIIQLVNLTLKAETQKAYLVENADMQGAWIPKSQVKNISLGEEIKEGDGKKLTLIDVLEIPHWLIVQKNLY